jgi:hypothetical protein
LRRDYVLDARLKNFIQQMGLDAGGSQDEKFLREVLARNRDHSAQGIACWMLADMVSSASEERPELSEEIKDKRRNAGLGSELVESVQASL